MFPANRDPTRMPLDVLFPDAYERSKQMIIHDFIFFGSIVVTAVVLGALVHLVAIVR